MTTLLKSDVVASTVIQNLRLEMPPDELLRDLSVSSQPESSVLDVTYDAPDRRQGVSILVEITTVFPELLSEKLGGRESFGARVVGSRAITANVWDPAHSEPGKLSPRPVRTAGFAGVLGLALGLVFAFLREGLDDRLRTRRQAEEWFGADVIAAVPRGLVGRPPYGVAGHSAPTKREHLRVPELLRASVEVSNPRNTKSILVTSADAEEGKSTVAAQVSVALARAGDDVICVEADLRRPALQRYLGIRENGKAPESGANALDRERALRDVSLTDGATSAVPDTRLARARSSGIAGKLRLYRADDGDAEPEAAELPQPVMEVINPASPTSDTFGELRVLPSSSLTAETLKPGPIKQLMNDLGRRARYLVFDAPPVLTMGDTYTLVRSVDRVILVARLGWTRKETAELARDLLQRLGVANLSIVLVGDAPPDGNSY